MRNVKLGLAALAAAASGFMCVGARAAPLEVYGNLPSIEQIAISPNGQLLAIDITKGEQRNIVIQDLAARKLIGGIRVGPVKVRNMQWAGDGHLIVTASSTTAIMGVLADRGEWAIASDYNVATHKMNTLLTDVDMAGDMIGGQPVVRTVGGKPVVFLTGVRFQLSGGLFTLFKVDLDTDRSSVVVDASGDADTDYLVGGDGAPLALGQYEEQSKQWVLKVWRGGAWKQAAAKIAAIETPELRGLGRDGRSILVGDYEDGHYKLRELSPDGATLSDPLPGPNGGETVFDPATHRLLGMETLVGDERAYRFFEERDQLAWNAIAAAYPGQTVTLVSWSDDRKKVIIHIDSPTDGPGYALVDMTAGASVWLGPEYLGLTNTDVSAVQSVQFKAKDGLDLTGYLTLPRGREPKNLPLVVFPHGGPAARDEPGFDWWAQAMASRGYAVLQVNYRGSDGFGWDFMSAGFGQWGRKMQTDLSDGVRYLAEHGIVDPKRACIVGASYGGYAALAGAALDTGVYRCAVDVSGPADLRAFVGWAKDRNGVGAARYWDRFMGSKSPTDTKLAEISPADHADAVTIPVLIIHGKDDTVVPFEQSQMMADALKKAGKPYDFVILNHEDHWLSKADTRLQMLKATVDFLEKYNPPG